MKIAIVGGGASGLMAAYTAAGSGAAVTVYEKNDRVGKKLLSTGNGKCNFSNLEMDESHYYSDNTEFIKAVLARFGAVDIVRFFESAGMLSKDKNGYLYPYSEQASTVLDTFRILMKERNVRVRTGEMVTGIVGMRDEKIKVCTAEGTEVYDKVILACGGKAAPKTGSDGNGYELLRKLGHTIHKTVPALVQLQVKEDFMKAISGVRAECKLTLFVDGKKQASERGEIQFTDYGISGIVTFQISRIAAYALGENRQVHVSVDFLPNQTPEELENFIRAKKSHAGKEVTCEEFITGLLNKKLMMKFLSLLNISPAAKVSVLDEKAIKRLADICKDFKLTVKGTNSFEQAQVTAGGIPLKEVTENLESRILKNCFITGELLDVDGKCGGYNLQWAWATGYIAGKEAANN